MSSSINKLGFMLLSFAGLSVAADTLLWEPGKVLAVEQVSSPAKEPDSSCRSVPKGAALPPACRPSNLRAQQFWRVTVEVGNKRFIVRPYRSPNLLGAFNQADTVYVDPNLTASSPVEVAIVSSKAIRLKTNQGTEFPAMVDSQELLSGPAVSLKVESPAPPRANAAPAVAVTSASKVVLLENGDFRDLELQEFTSQDIGDGAVLYSFTGDISPARIASNPPILLLLMENDAAAGGNLELSRLQVGRGTRQLVYSSAKNRSASPLPVTVTQVSATLRRVTLKEPLPPGEYVVLLENSRRGFLFSVR